MIHMNILYLAHRIPFPPNKGDKLRSFRQLEHLTKRHRVWCACFLDSPSDGEYVRTLAAYCHDLGVVRLDRRRATLRGIGGLTFGRTITESFYSHPKMTATLDRWMQEVSFDAVVAFSSSMAPYALHVPATRHVLDLCDLDSRKWLDYAAASHGPVRPLYVAEGNRLAMKEQAWLEEFDATILITKAESAALADAEEAVGRGKLHIVGNGVTLPDLFGRTQGDELAAGRQVVGFIGAMDYRPNVDAVCWFVDRCWPWIHGECPQALFRIVGRSPARKVRQLGNVAGVEVVGEVDDAPAEVARFTISVAPMQIARGLQNKVLEAMAAAKPVVLSSRAAEGISAGNAREYVVADTAAQTVDAVVRLLHDEVERERIGLAARRYVAAHHSWDWELQRFELIVTGQIGPISAPAAKTPVARHADPALAIAGRGSSATSPADMSKAGVAASNG